MISAPLRSDEADTLAALHALEVLDTESEAAFDALVQVAAAVCGTPVSLISLIDADRQWFKANLGLPGVAETPRNQAFCAHAVLGDDLLEVPDALQDERFFDNPLVTAAPHIRFYAGMPVRVGHGSAIGTLCVIDRQPRRLDDHQRKMLRQISLAASQMMTGRSALRRQQVAHKDLAARLQDLRLLVDAVPSMLGYLNTDLTYRFANRAYGDWFGVDANTLVGRHISLVLGPELFAANQPRLEAALRGNPQIFERTFSGPGGRTRHSLANYLPDVVDGVVVGLLIEVNDLTSLKVAETRASALKDERDRLAMVARLTSNAVIITDAQRRIAWVNAGFERITGYSAAEAVGRKPRELLGFEGTDPSTVERLTQAQRAGQAMSCEILNRSKSGRVYWAAKELQPMHDAAGQVVGFVSIESDITDRMRATEAAEESSRVKSDFIATVSHELRTPLQSINGYAELGHYIAQAESQDRFASMFDKVLLGGHRMLSLVNDLLDLSAIDASNLAFFRKTEDLRVLVHQVSEELAPLVRARDIRLELASSMPALPVHAEARRMQQVIRNVLANAIRFAPVGSEVVVDGADLGDQGIELTVRDQGPGIPPDELEEIFSPFVQSSRTRDGSGGSGLGLAICRRIMTAHEGTIAAANAPGAGALLRLWLPATRHQRDPERQTAAHATATAPPHPLSPNYESAS